MSTSHLIGCAASSDASLDTHYTFIYLKSGPSSGQGDAEARTKMFQGHMSNMQRLADERKLLIAGPFSKPADKTWRGIFIFDIPTVEQAREIAASDPGVIAGEFIADIHPLRGSSSFRRTPDLEREMLAKQGSAPPREPGSSPPNIRAYVMVTADQFDAASAAIAKSEWKEKMVWRGRFTGTSRGVFVLDESDAAKVRAAINESAGTCSVDGWYSTTSLTGLMTSSNKAE